MDVGCSSARSGTRTVPADTSATDRVSMSTATIVRKKPHRPRTSSPRVRLVDLPPVSNTQSPVTVRWLSATGCSRLRPPAKDTADAVRCTPVRRLSPICHGICRRRRSCLRWMSAIVAYCTIVRGAYTTVGEVKDLYSVAAADDRFRPLQKTRSLASSFLAHIRLASSTTPPPPRSSSGSPCRAAVATYNNILASFSYRLLFAPTANHRRRQIVTCKRHSTVTRVYYYNIKLLYIIALKHYLYNIILM